MQQAVKRISAAEDRVEEAEFALFGTSKVSSYSKSGVYKVCLRVCSWSKR